MIAHVIRSCRKAALGQVLHIIRRLSRNWWLRSPYLGNSSNFNNVNNNGGSNNNNASNAYALVCGSSPGRQSNPRRRMICRAAKSVPGRREKENLTGLRKQTNIDPDAFSRTLLAWCRLMVMRHFMAGNAMPLYATIRQGYGVSSKVKA